MPMPLPPPPVDDRRNVFGQPLASCNQQPMTGFYRTGCCETGPEDLGLHTVCCVMTDAFLAFSKQNGNDLSTPRPQFGFPGLKAGDRWCVCVGRWRQAMLAGAAAPVVLESTHEEALAVVTLDDLRRHAVSAG
jgi:uncharacterized protein (DUF2237 family)